MIKGVNKQVLEITNTENPYFERIVFFVKPEYKGADRAKLKKEAEISVCGKLPLSSSDISAFFYLFRLLILYHLISLSSKGSPHSGQNLGGWAGSSGSQPHLSHL